MRFKVDGREVHAATGGKLFDATRPTIVFIHGAGLNHTCWQLQARWFAWHGWSVLALDLPGHSTSAGPPLPSITAMRDWLLAVMATVQVDKAALVGHSMGAVIALETAAHAPRQVSGLALLGISSAMPVHPTLLAAARDEPARAYDMMTAWCFGSTAKLGRNAAPGIWMTGAARAVFDRNTDGILATDLAACANWTTGMDSARRVAAPTLAVLGTEDVMTPARKGQELVGVIAGARTLVLPDSGHMMMLEAPDATLDALSSHFKLR